MKTIKITLILSCLSFGLFAQNRPIDKLFEKYAAQDGFASVYISQYMFSLFSNLAGTEEEKDEFEKIISGLESIRILTVEDSVLDKKINFHAELANELPWGDYKELMTIKEKDQDLKMLIKETGGKISEFLMVGGGDSNVLISITGTLDLAAIAKLSQTMNVDGLKDLEKLNGTNK